VEHKASKLGTALAAAVLGLGLPAVASAQALPSDQMPDGKAVDVDTDVTTSADITPVMSAMTSLGMQVDQLSSMSNISSGDIALVPINDMNLSAEQRYMLAQNADPSAEASLQRALDNVTVQEVSGTGTDQHTLADHLRMVGVDPAGVVAVDVDDQGIVTVYYQ
jgi:hypothetical protein